MWYENGKEILRVFNGTIEGLPCADHGQTPLFTIQQIKVSRREISIRAKILVLPKRISSLKTRGQSWMSRRSQHILDDPVEEPSASCWCHECGSHVQRNPRLLCQNMDDFTPNSSSQRKSASAAASTQLRSHCAGMGKLFRHNGEPGPACQRAEMTTLSVKFGTRAVLYCRTGTGGGPVRTVL